MRGDAFGWPFDGDPFNCCQAARLSRRGWESQGVAGGWMGRAKRGEGARPGDAPGRKGAAAAFLPSLRLGVWKSAGAVREEPRPGAMRGAEPPARCLREGVGE